MEILHSFFFTFDIHLFNGWMETNLKTKKGQINNKRQQLESWETKNETKMEVSAKDTEINCTDQKVMRGVMEKDKRKKKKQQLFVKSSKATTTRSQSNIILLYLSFVQCNYNTNM